MDAGDGGAGVPAVQRWREAWDVRNFLSIAGQGLRCGWLRLEWLLA
jgi:hypothetical protein